MKKQLQPWIAKAISSLFLLRAKRRFHDLKRRVKGQPHLVSVFIRVNDPYSYLLLQVLPELEQRYDVQYSYHVVSHLQEHMYPEPALWHDNALKDSSHIASLYSLDLPISMKLPSAEMTDAVTVQLLALERGSRFVEKALMILRKYWAGEVVDVVSDPRLKQRLLQNEALMDSLGHYLSATVHYGGEWYWGIDRLAHLEKRLNALNLSRSENVIKYQEGTKYFCKRLSPLDRFPKRPHMPLTIYFSARSPYSYLGLERGVALAKHYDVPIVVKPVLPMMMRDMYVPPRKQWYIFSDTKREAHSFGIDYGFVADPLGEGVERCYALFEYAQTRNREVEYLLAFARAVNSRAIHSDTDLGMKTIVEEAGLDWVEAEPILRENLETHGWRPAVESNYEEMHAQGLWGVPCFHYDDVAVWGQDRVDVIEQAICRSIEGANE